jgi:hypothetical protein
MVICPNRIGAGSVMGAAYSQDLGDRVRRRMKTLRLCAGAVSGHVYKDPGRHRTTGDVIAHRPSGPMNGETFRAWIEQFLVPELKARRYRGAGQSVGP